MSTKQTLALGKRLVWRFGFILVLTLLLTRCVDPSLVELVFVRREQIPFDTEGWHGPMVGQDGIFTGTRLKMVDDLLEQYDFHGWAVAEVEELLGESACKQNEDGRNLVCYDLREGLKWLNFEIDDEEQVIDYWVYIN